MAVKRVSKYRPNFLVPLYRMVRAGIPEIDVCRSLGVSRMSLYVWRKKYPEVEECYQIARKDRDEASDFPRWVYNRLSPEIRQLWDRIEAWHDAGQDNLVEVALLDHGVRVQQQLFLHALCVKSFNPSEAMRAVNVTKRELDEWLARDSKFAELVEEVNYHKANFFEQALVDLVRAQNPSAVIFANKTVNRNRGYGQVTDVNHTHKGVIMHGVVDLTDVMNDLSPECRSELMEALRRRDEASKRQPKVLEHEPSLDQQLMARITQGDEQ